MLLEGKETLWFNSIEEIQSCNSELQQQVKLSPLSADCNIQQQPLRALKIKKKKKKISYCLLITPAKNLPQSCQAQREFLGRVGRKWGDVGMK